MDVNTLVSIILALQFASFGWRINREISVGDSGRKTWFPLPDIVNILSMLSVILWCIIFPLVTGFFGKDSRIVLSIAFVLIAFHPICMIGHYRLFSSSGRTVYKSKGKDYPYCTGPELLLSILSFFFASFAGFLVWRQGI